MKHIKMYSILIALFFSAIICNSTIAADKNNKFSTRGVGGEKCETLVKIVESKNDKQLEKYVPVFIGWVDGYISYVNRIEKNTFNVVPFISGPEILALVIHQCKQKPNLKIEETVNHTISVLAKYRIKNESQIINISVGKKSGAFYKETIFEIQNRLNKLGFLQEKPSGSYTENTKKAIKLFQKSQNITDSGFPTIDTTIKLLYR